ncbi:MAG: GNAT family N-acetyltransferase [Planctomycetota bacterium]
MEIAPVRSDQLDLIRSLLRAYEQEMELDLCFQQFDEEIEALPGCYAEPEGGLWLADEVGLVALRPIDRGAEVKRLYVAPAGRGLGLGRRLAEHCIAEARARGYRDLWLDTLASMDAANHIYRSLGFVECAPYYDNPLDGVRYFYLGL